jgi:hypothetical protein
MDILDKKIAIQDENSMRFGWTNNIRIRYYFEKLHDIKKTIELIQKDNTTYYYLLKRLIVTGRTNMFKKFLTPDNMKYWQEEGIQYLLMYSIKFNKFVIFKYIIENYNFTYVSPFVKNAINNIESETVLDKFLNPLYEILFKNKALPKPPYSTLCNAFDFAKFHNDIFMLYVIHRTNETYNLLGNNDDIISMSFPDYLKVFSYEYKPNKKVFN